MRQGGSSHLVCLGILSLALLYPRQVAASWPDTPGTGVPLCVSASNQNRPASVADGAGGTIVAWADSSHGNWDIYAQRISAAGTVQWTADGVALCSATKEQSWPIITSDGGGGAIVAWDDWRNDRYEIYAAHVSAAGTVLWGDTNGVAVCTATGDVYVSAIAPDGAGGAIITWMDLRGAAHDIFAQRISANGALLWGGAEGVPICTAAGAQYYPLITSDGFGGAVIAWIDNRRGRPDGYCPDLYAQRVNPSGARVWTTDGVALCTAGLTWLATGDQYSPGLVGDGARGAIVAWMDERSGDMNIFAQRVDSTGATMWVDNGVVVCAAANNQDYPRIVSDEEHGAIVSWFDYRDSGPDVYAQRVFSTGVVGGESGGLYWTANGVALCTAEPTWLTLHVLVSDRAGGAISAWMDERSGNGDVYAQRVFSTGVVGGESGGLYWTANGVALCTATGDQQSPTIASDDAGGAFVAWTDFRNDDGSLTNSDIYVQRVWASGLTPVLLTLVGTVVTGDGVELTWYTGRSGGTVATVYRCLGSNEWTRIGEVGPDGAGYLRFTDPLHTTAPRAGYRLGIVDAGVEGFYGETWVDLQASNTSLALDPVRPNPSTGEALTVCFSLASSQPATLELLDVTGRRIVRREVGSMGAGPRTLDLREGQRLAPGLYLVRLTQGANTRVVRVVALK
jgi:hypothetical protein